MLNRKEAQTDNIRFMHGRDSLLYNTSQRYIEGGGEEILHTHTKHKRVN